MIAALLGLLVGASGSAQVALEQFQPAPLAADGFMLGRPVLLSPHAFTLLAGLDYANDPLVYQLDRRPRLRQRVVATQLVVQLGGALAVRRRVTVFANLPIYTVMRGESPLVLTQAAPDGAALGDLSLGARVGVLGSETSVFALALDLRASLPTAELVNRRQHYAGAERGSYEGALIAELRTGRFASRVRLGVRLQREVALQNLELGPALSFGAGVGAQLVPGLALHAELFGATYTSHAFRAQHTPVELLLGPKFQRQAWWFGAAAGPGLVAGFGSPDFRALLTVGFAASWQAPAPQDPSVMPAARPAAQASSPLPRAAQAELDVEFGHVEFAAHNHEHAAASTPTLQAVQSILTVNRHLLRTRVEGHADDSQDASTNLELSRRRAHAVTRWLIAHGIAATRLEPVACGDRYPVATESTASARQKNRRVDFYVVDPAPREPVSHTDCEPLESR